MTADTFDVIVIGAGPVGEDDGQAAWLDQAGIALYRGHGRLGDSARTVEVTGANGSTTTLTARHAVVVATGSGALVPDRTLRW